MTFISYAQNYEDAVLWRALGKVERGFYIDVGAFSPDLDSVTRAFYDRGWRGINLEPNPHYHAKLEARRPRDTNLRLAAGETEGSIQLHIIADTGLSTVRPDIANRHRQDGWAETLLEVPQRTLSAIWDDHVEVDHPVHFLKVDVEGHEESVLKGLDLNRHRAWIIVVEATVPLSRTESHGKWEGILLGAHYQMAYWDGLNRFYVADEKKELLEAFSTPAEVLQETTRAEDLFVYGSSDERAGAEAPAAVLSRPRRPLWERLFFHDTGKPKKVLRRLLFHNSGKPRRKFRSLILHPDGRPHRPFRRWLSSAEYRALPGAIIEPGQSAIRTVNDLSPRARHFFDLLSAAGGERRD